MKTVMFHQDHEQAVQRQPFWAGQAPLSGLATLRAALWRKRLWPVAASLIFAALAAAYSLTVPDRYRAVSQILIEPHAFNALTPGAAPAFPTSESASAFLDREAQTITSETMLRRIADREGLTHDPEYHSRQGVLVRLLRLGSKSGEPLQQIVEQLSQNLMVTRNERSFTMDIAITASTADKAARLSNAFAKAYLEEQANRRADMSRRTGTALAGRLTELRERVQQAEDRVENHKAQKNLSVGNAAFASEDQLAAVSSQLSFAKSRSSDARARLEQIDRVRGQAAERGHLPEALTSQTIGLLRQQLSEAQKRIASLENSLGPMHPDFVAAQTALREAQRRIADEISKLRAAARTEFERAQANERALQAQFDTLTKGGASTSHEMLQLRELEREVEISRAVYQSFLQRSRDVSDQEHLGKDAARIITAATPPTERFGTSRWRMILSAVVAGLVLGLLIVFLSECPSLLQHYRDQQAAISAAHFTAPEAMVTATAVHAPHHAAFSPAEPLAVPHHAGISSSDAPLAGDDLVRLLGMLGQLEYALNRHGLPR